MICAKPPPMTDRRWLCAFKLCVFRIKTQKNFLALCVNRAKICVKSSCSARKGRGILMVQIPPPFNAELRKEGLVMKKLVKLAALLLTAALTLTLLAGCSTAEDRSYLNDLHKAYANYFVDDQNIERTDAMDAKAQKALGYLQSNLTAAEGTDLEDAAIDLLDNKESKVIALLGLDLKNYEYYIGVAEVPALENGMYDKTQLVSVAETVYYNNKCYCEGGNFYSSYGVTIGYAIGKVGNKTVVVGVDAYPMVKD